MNDMQGSEMRYKLKGFMALLLVLFMSVSWAKTGEVASAEATVVRVTTNIVNNLDVHKAVYQKNSAALMAMIRKEVLPFIDFDAMAKLTLGKFWRRASKAQRIRFRNAYREMLVRSYGKAMLKYSGATIRAGNSVPNRKPGYVTVRTLVTPRGSSAVAANYDVRKKGGKWMAYNVQIAGINLVTNFRTNFTREVSATGLDALIARLEKNNQ